MELDKLAVSKRFKSWLKTEFGSIEKGAKSIGRSAASLKSNYLNGKSVPGGELIADLIKAGCDIEWLLLGEPGNDLNTKDKVIIKKMTGPSQLSDDSIVVQFPITASKLNDLMEEGDQIILVKSKGMQISSDNE